MPKWGITWFGGICLAAAAGMAATPGLAAVSLDPDFWADYVPNRQYTAVERRALLALEEGDLLATARDIDGLELRLIGRETATSDLISVRVVIDSVTRERLQLKTVPFSLSPNAARPRLERRQLAREQADALLDLLESVGFWDAPYSESRSEPADRIAPDPGDACEEGHWTVEAVRPGSYQLISRSSCTGLDPMVTALRDYLLGLVARERRD